MKDLNQSFEPSLKVPFKYSKKLRNTLQEYLPFKLKINQALRDYAKEPIGKIISFKELINFITLTRYFKRETIPSNMFYNKHVREFYKSNPHGTHKACVEAWHKLKT